MFQRTSRFVIMKGQKGYGVSGNLYRVRNGSDVQQGIFKKLVCTNVEMERKLEGAPHASASSQKTCDE
jgi:hypothetical protein